MIANVENKSMDMEVRDINVFLPAYIRSYMYVSKNESPDKIIFPMFPTVPHPYDASKRIPVEYYPMDSPIVAEIAEDGRDVKETTEAELDAKDVQEDRIKELTAKVKELEATTEGRGGVVGTTVATDDEVSGQAAASLEVRKIEPDEEVAEVKNIPTAVTPTVIAPAPKAVTKPGLAPAREPKLPDVVVKPGEGNLDGMGSRDRRDQGRIAKDILPEAEVDEEKEVPFEKETGRDSKGKPTVKGK